MNYVYKYTNTISGKSYIGLTCRIDIRLNQHFNNNKGIFGKALRSYGKDVFILDILFQSENRKEAVDKEQELIKNSNVLYPNGYNMSDFKQLAYSNGNKPIMNKNCLEAARKARLGSKHSEETKLKMSIKAKNRAKPSRQKAVYAFKESLILEFDSISDAARQLKLNRRSINNAVTGRSKSSGGYTFKYKE